jgi:hypothetical protein
MKKILLLAAMMVAFTFGNFYGSFTGTPAEAQRWDHWVYYDDIRAPATIISTGSGAGTAADRHTDGTLLFATGADEELRAPLNLTSTGANPLVQVATCAGQ